MILVIFFFVFILALSFYFFKKTKNEKFFTKSRILNFLTNLSIFFISSVVFVYFFTFLQKKFGLFDKKDYYFFQNNFEKNNNLKKEQKNNFIKNLFFKNNDKDLNKSIIDNKNKDFVKELNNQFDLKNPKGIKYVKSNKNENDLLNILNKKLNSFFSFVYNKCFKKKANVLTTFESKKCTLVEEFLNRPIIPQKLGPDQKIFNLLNLMRVQKTKDDFLPYLAIIEEKKQILFLKKHSKINFNLFDQKYTKLRGKIDPLVKLTEENPSQQNKEKLKLLRDKSHKMVEQAAQFNNTVNKYVSLKASDPNRLNLEFYKINLMKNFRIPLPIFEFENNFQAIIQPVLKNIEVINTEPIYDFLEYLTLSLKNSHIVIEEFPKNFLEIIESVVDGCDITNLSKNKKAQISEIDRKIHLLANLENVLEKDYIKRQKSYIKYKNLTVSKINLVVDPKQNQIMQLLHQFFLETFDFVKKSLRFQKSVHNKVLKLQFILNEEYLKLQIDKIIIFMINHSKNEVNPYFEFGFMKKIDYQEQKELDRVSRKIVFKLLKQQQK